MKATTKPGRLGAVLLTAGMVGSPAHADSDAETAAPNLLTANAGSEEGEAGVGATPATIPGWTVTLAPGTDGGGMLYVRDTYPEWIDDKGVEAPENEEGDYQALALRAALSTDPACRPSVTAGESYKLTLLAGNLSREGWASFNFGIQWFDEAGELTESDLYFGSRQSFRPDMGELQLQRTTPDAPLFEMAHTAEAPGDAVSAGVYIETDGGWVILDNVRLMAVDEQ